MLPKGFIVTAVNCGISASKKKDLALIYSKSSAAGAGCFTSNSVKAAPVILSRKHVANGIARAIIANSGCANACTGQKGLRDARNTAEFVAKGLNIKSEDVLIASTGVIGQALPMKKIKSGIKSLVHGIQLSLKDSSTKRSDSKGVSSEPGALAEAILTTDTFPKISCRKINIDKKEVKIFAVAKGAGMIHPDMATMLCFILSDLNITSSMLAHALRKSIEESFNMVTVDACMSTNDSVLILANGMARNRKIIRNDRNFKIFQKALDDITLELARMLARDGEGATKYVEIHVKNARTFSDAKKIARTIASSQLVKTALFGSDTNWGRIIAAAGASGIALLPDKIDIYIGNICMARKGCGVKYNRVQARKILNKKKVSILVDLHAGKKAATIFTCDLSYDYVHINSCYMT